MKHFTPLSLLVSATLVAPACLGEGELDPNYCGNNDGDAFCGRKNPATPYCVLSSDSCFETAGIEFGQAYGCVAEVPTLECRSECGISNGNSCIDPTDPTVAETTETLGSSTTSEPTTEPETETEDPSTSTGPECMDNTACLDAAAPICVSGTCSPCSASEDPPPNDACEALDASLPLCVDDACVQCTSKDADACEGVTPLCDDESNTCVACEFHEQCEAVGLRACNIATGACFSADAAAVTEVDGGTSGALQAAIDGVADGAEHTIILTGSAGVSHNAVVNGGKTIAIISTDSTIQTLAGLAGSPTLAVAGSGTTVYLHRLALTGNGADVGIRVLDDGTLYTDSVRVAQNSGGGITLDAGTTGFLRNSMVGRNGDEFGSTTGISTAGELEILYSSIVANDGDDADSLQCSGGAVVVRNSILIGSDADSINCGVLEASNSAFDGVVPGNGNENVGDLEPGWFLSVVGADFHLSATGQVRFADVAIWEDGDPPFDFDGEDRPNTDGADDYAGADAP